MKKHQLLSLLWLISSLRGQNLVDLRTQSKNVDFSGATATIPAKSGTALPASCNLGELFFKTNNSPGQNLYVCAPANNWTQLASGASGIVSSATAGQFAFYAATGSTIAGHTLAAADIPALNYQAPLTFTGTGSKTASSTGTLLNNDCAKWDPNGNIIDAGAPCASVAAGSAGQFAFYSASGAALTPHTLAASDIPALSYQAPLTFTGSGSKTASSSGVSTANNCAKWDANGNVVDAGAPCGSGSALSTPSSTVVGAVPQWSNTAGTALAAGLGVVTAVGSPGSDSNLATEKSIRTAIASAVAGAGSLPAQTGTAGYLVTNGTSASWGNISTGGSGALDCATVPGVCDIVTALVPLKAAANTWTGVNKFSQFQVSLYTVATLPTCNSSFEGQMEGVSDAVSPSYLAAVSGGGSVHVPVYCNGTAWVAH